MALNHRHTQSLTRADSPLYSSGEVRPTDRSITPPTSARNAHRIFVAGVAAALVAVTAACGSSAGTSSTSSTSTTSTTSTSGTSGTDAAGASDSGTGGATFTLYTSMGYGQQTTDAFTQKTGIKVNLVEDSGSALLTKVSAEKNNPQWTLLWTEGDTAFNTLDQAGELKAPLEVNASYNDVGKSIIPTDKSYLPSSVTVMAGIECNGAKVTTMPASWQDLTKPEYGKLGMTDPSQSGPAYPFIAGMMEQLGGVDQGKAWFQTLKNNGLQVFAGSGDVRHALETGQIDCAIMQSSGALGEIKKNPATASYKPQVVFPAKQTLLPGVFGISKAASADAQASAQKFIDFVNSTEGYDIVKTAAPTGASLNWPVITGATAPSDVPAMPAYQHLDPAKWGPQQTDIVSWFLQTIKS